MDHASSEGDLFRPAGLGADPRLLWLARVLAMAAVHALSDYLLGALTRQATVSSGLAIGSGFSLACMLRWGWSLWPGAFLSQVIGLCLAGLHGGSISLPGAFGFGAAEVLQDLLAWHLLQRWTQRPTELNRSRDAVALVLVVVLVAAPVGALCSIATFFLAYGIDEGSQLRGMWTDVWLVSARAMLIGTPATLALLATPRRTRKVRLLSVALPLLLAAFLLFLAISTLGRWDKQRQTLQFDREAVRDAALLDRRLADAQQALAATRGVLVAAPHIDAAALRAAAQAFLPEAAGIRFIAQAELTPSASTGDDPFRLRLVGAGRADSGRMSPGLPAWSVEALRTGAATATPALLDGEGRRRVFLLQPLGKPDEPESIGRADAVARLALVSIDVASLLGSVLEPGMQACLLDESAQQADQRYLAGAVGCERASELQPELRRTFSVGGRRWMLRLHATSAAPFHNSPVVQLFGGLGLAIVGLLVLLLLTLSARTDRIEALVEQRTAELSETLLALRRNQQRFRSVFDHAPVGVLVADLKGNPLDFNPALQRMLGSSLRERPNLDPLQVNAALTRQLIDSGDAVVGHRRQIRHRDGTVVEVQQLTTLLRDEQRRPEHLVSVIHDISDQLKVVEHERARMVADAANRAKSEFLSRMSHELRTPLNGLLGFAQLLQLEREPLTPIQRAWVDRIGQAGWYLLAMINDVLDLSRVETGNLKVVLEPQDAHELSRECLTLLSPLAARLDISVRLTLDAEARYVIADATRLREILNNLMSNAVKYNRPNGSVHLHVRNGEPGFVDLSVSDTGKGLTPEQLASLFEPFNRLGQERGNIDGTGIGLVITRRLAELMNGSISVESQPGRGTTFTLHLPASGEAAVPPAESGDVTRGSSPQLGPKRLVYIEDNPVNIEVMRAVIALRSELSLTVYERGEAGLDALLLDPPDLVLLDVNLPDMDGLTLLKRLRAGPGCERLPVVIVSADAMDEHIAKGMHNGATHYLTKPFAVPDLMQLLDELLRPAGPAHGSAH